MNTHPTSAAPLRLGFVGLTDCAPLAVAQHLGLFEQQGLTVEFSREPSWANMRDKLALGLFDGAHLLAPMLLAANLNLEKLAQPLCASLCLGLGGNAIVLTASLIAEAQITPDQTRNPLQSSMQLGQWRRSEASRVRKLRFAAVHPYSTHYYELCAWLAAGGIDPLTDIDMVYYPPQQMPQRLRDGEIDGFCAGEPWGTIATEACPHEHGVILVTGPQLWANKSEKMFTVRESWAERNPEQHLGLITALIEAGRWLDESAEHRHQAAEWLAEPQWLGLPLSQLLPGLSLTPDAGGVPWLRFFRDNAQFPRRSHGVFYLTQMLRWGHIDRAVDMRLIAERSYRPELYRHAARALDLSVPTVDYLPEGLHQSPWTLAAATSGPTAMGADWFFDGSTFDPLDPASYLEYITAHNPGMSHLIPSPLHLRLLNPIFQLHSTALELHP